MSRPAIDSDYPACLAVAHALRNQRRERLPLLGQGLPGPARLAAFHAPASVGVAENALRISDQVAEPGTVITEHLVHVDELPAQLVHGHPQQRVRAERCQQHLGVGRCAGAVDGRLGRICTMHELRWPQRRILDFHH